MFKMILVYADNADDALKAVQEFGHAVDLAPHAIVTFIYIFPVSHHSQEILKENFSEQGDSMIDIFQKAENHLDELNIEHKKIIRLGNPSQEISLITQFNNYDLLIIPQQYTSTSKDVSEIVTRKVKCPVFVLEKNKGLSQKDF